MLPFWFINFFIIVTKYLKRKLYLKEERKFILAYHFRGFSTRSAAFIGTGHVVRQDIMVESHSIENLLIS